MRAQLVLHVSCRMSVSCLPLRQPHKRTSPRTTGTTPRGRSQSGATEASQRRGDNGCRLRARARAALMALELGAG
eukprot:scaffold1044_cov120-Isochrysis_galbana.AAC.30